jgi:hypothetical protein
MKKLHQPWTEAEERRLLELIENGKPSYVAAAALKRSTASAKTRP